MLNPNTHQLLSNLLNYKEAAEMLRISPQTLRVWVHLKKIRYVKLGSRTVFRLSDLEDLIISNTVEAEVK